MLLELLHNIRTTEIIFIIFKNISYLMTKIIIIIIKQNKTKTSYLYFVFYYLQAITYFYLYDILLCGLFRDMHITRIAMIVSCDLFLTCGYGYFETRVLRNNIEENRIYVQTFLMIQHVYVFIIYGVYPVSEQSPVTGFFGSIILRLSIIYKHSFRWTSIVQA